MSYVPFKVRKRPSPTTADAIGVLASSMPVLFSDIDLRDAFEERAAIMQFEGGLTKEAAEKSAYAAIILEATG